MPNDSFQLVALLPAPPARVYSAWLDAAEHAAFTRELATSEPRPGGQHTAWSGYISGRHVELATGMHIVQTWRTTEFPDGAIDSRVELTFEPHGAGETRVTLVHTDIPPGQGDRYRKGWASHYFEPLRAYLGRAKGATPKSKPKATAKKAKPAATKKASGAPKKAARKATRAAPPRKTAAKRAAQPRKAAARKPKKTAKPAKRAAKKRGH